LDPDSHATARRAATAWILLRRREDVIRALDGHRLYEVPFSVRLPGSPTVLRGTVDCLVRRPDGSMAVVEFKTGRPQEWHQRQLDIYVEAARQLFPGIPISGVLLYA